MAQMALSRLRLHSLVLRSQPVAFQTARAITTCRRLDMLPLSSLRSGASLGIRQSLLNRTRSMAQGYRWFSEEAGAVLVVDKSYVIQSFSDPSVVIIDVREESEIDETGPIEVDMREAENIPLGQIETALSFAEEDFEEEYGFSKPGLDQEIIFTCRSGVRSDMACRIAAQKGYVNTKNYQGSALEWFAE